MLLFEVASKGIDSPLFKMLSRLQFSAADIAKRGKQHRVCG